MLVEPLVVTLVKMNVSTGCGDPMDLTDLLHDACQRGFTHDFSQEAKHGRYRALGERLMKERAWIVESISVDAGTDPGDDATIYLIETTSGLKGHLIISDAFHADPDKAAFIDKLSQRAP
jgi:hypothetical protein